MGDVTVAWEELMTELRRVAPAVAAAVLPPGGMSVAEAQERLGTEFTPDLVEWFGLHGGIELDYKFRFLPMNWPLDLAEAVRFSAEIREIWQDSEPRCEGDQVAGTVMETWLPQYVAVGNDGMGGELFVDLRPGPRQGCVREWERAQADDFENSWDGLAPLLREIAAALRDGSRVGSWTPVIVDGGIEWEVP